MDHQFVEYIPDTVEPDILYISLEYNIAVHKCACGCGIDVVTPLSPAEWALTYNGQTVSLWPSIGNWSFPCKSHYIVKHGQVRWATRFDSAKIEAVRQRDLEAKVLLYAASEVPVEVKADAKNQQPNSGRPVKRGGWRRLIDWLGL